MFRSDVDIMRRICSMFREEMIKISGVDPFCYITIASCCMAVYRSRHLQANTIAMVPVNGYINNTNYSSDAIRWLDFVAADQGITIEHALNGSGEIKIGGVSVDGFCRQTNTIYQFHGCFYHGCADCYEGDTIHPLKKLPMATLLAKTKGTTDKFRASGYEVIELWEHRFKSMMKENKDLRVLFVENHEVQERLNPRDSFFGGRTNAIKLFYEGEAKYVDFTSLYYIHG
ncbi:uncharacterized protein [Parasteatoda tepidariorum]|uniref:uncharacterized protein n=1 Tax=Parasteatoda tepidariorum TaxID=114398 RepID=UPI0039BD699D